MLKRNVRFSKKLKMSSWRKAAIGTWQVTGDSQIYSMMCVNAEPALEYLKQNPGVSLTHLVGSAIAKVIENYPQINSIERFGRLYQRENIDLFFQVATDSKGQDLSGYTVRNADKKSPHEIAVEMRECVSRMKQGDDREYKKVKSTLGRIPGILMRPIITFLGFFLYKLNLWTPLLGSPRDSFGTMMITNIGSLGMQRGWAPLVPYSHVPVILTLGKVYDRPVAKDGEVVIQKTIDCCFTTDHRIIDGLVGSKMEKEFLHIITHPESL